MTLEPEPMDLMCLAMASGVSVRKTTGKPDVRGCKSSVSR
ncbi:hypothetical protein J2T21_001045 [Paeniglutamicibacter psychrophenolicus]|nr:hypothetical protein [Paeniglutamicibacter psychrophenolicus]